MYAVPIYGLIIDNSRVLSKSLRLLKLSCQGESRISILDEARKIPLVPKIHIDKVDIKVAIDRRASLYAICDVVVLVHGSSRRWRG